LGHVDANLIAPPHTVESIKRCISKVENITDHTGTLLFASLSNATPMDGEERVAVLTGTGLGSTPAQPLALVQVGEGKTECSHKIVIKAKQTIRE
jgi:hypothetical protein